MKARDYSTRYQTVWRRLVTAAPLRHISGIPLTDFIGMTGRHTILVFLTYSNTECYCLQDLGFLFHSFTWLHITVISQLKANTALIHSRQDDETFLYTHTSLWTSCLPITKSDIYNQSIVCYWCHIHCSDMLKILYLKNFHFYKALHFITYCAPKRNQRCLACCTFLPEFCISRMKKEK